MRKKNGKDSLGQILQLAAHVGDALIQVDARLPPLALVVGALSLEGGLANFAVATEGDLLARRSIVVGRSSGGRLVVVSVSAVVVVVVVVVREAIEAREMEGMRKRRRRRRKRRRGMYYRDGWDVTSHDGGRRDDGEVFVCGNGNGGGRQGEEEDGERLDRKSVV